MAGVKIYQTGGDKDLIETRRWERELAALNIGEDKAIKMVNAIIDDTPVGTTLEIRAKNREEERWDIVYRAEGRKGGQLRIPPAAPPAPAHIEEASPQTEIPAWGSTPPIRYPKAERPKTTRAAARVVSITSKRSRPKGGPDQDGDK